MIGNNLVRRKFEVVFVEPTSTSAPPNTSKSMKDSAVVPSGMGEGVGFSLPEYKETWLRLADLKRGDDEVEIEEVIIGELLGRHERWIAAGKSGDS